MIRRKIRTKIISLTIALALVIGLVLVGWDSRPESMSLSYTRETELVDAIEDKEQTIQGSVEDFQCEKKETVRVKAKADGTVSEIKVSEWIKNGSISDSIKDYTVLTDIKNTEGDEEFTLGADGTIVWENHGENIFYEGKSAKELPVSVKVRYFYENQEITPEEIAGKTGEVKIRFEYENHTNTMVQIGNREVETVVPFLMCTLLYLPTDVFSEVKAEHAQVMENADNIVVVGYSFPGLKDYIHLADYEPTEDIELENFIEITAYAKEFELDFTATVATTGLLEDLDTADLDDVDDMIRDMDDLKDGVNDMNDGVDKLYDGVIEVHDYINEYIGAVGAVNDGVGELEKGAKLLNDQNDALKKGTAALKDGLTTLDKSLKDIQFGGDDKFSAGMNAMGTAAGKLNEDATKLSTQLNALQSILTEISNFAGNVTTYKQNVDTKVTEAKGSIAGAKTQLGSVTDNANVAARSQAKSQATSAIDGVTIDFDSILGAEATLTEEQKNTLANEFKQAAKMAAEGAMDSIDVGNLVGETITLLDSSENSLNQVGTLTIPNLSLDLTAINETLSDMQEQLIILKTAATGMTQLSAQMEDLQKSFDTLKTGVAELAKGSEQLNTGVVAYLDGTSKMVEGIGKLHEGTDALASVGGEFNDGFDEMHDGITELRDGVREFKEDGVDEFTKYAGKELQAIVDGLRGSKYLDGQYNNYAGINPDMKGSVTFIIETEAIEK